MNNKKILISFLLIVLVALSVGVVSAAEDVDSGVVADADTGSVADVDDGAVDTVDEGAAPATTSKSIVPTEKNSESIQAAIDGAEDGDTIDLEADTYTFNTTVEITKNITINGQSGTIITGMGDTKYQKTFTLFHANAAGITFKNLQFTSGFTPVYGDPSSIDGLCIIADSANYVSILNCGFTNYASEVYFVKSNYGLVEGCTFKGQATYVNYNPSENKETGTKAVNIGGNSKFTTVRNCTFDGQMLDGCSIFSGATNTSVLNNTFANNVYAIYFGGAATPGSIIANNTFTSCGYVLVEGNKYKVPVLSVDKSSDGFVILENTFKGVTDNDVLISTESGNTAHGAASQIGSITINNNIVTLADGTNPYLVKFVRTTSENGGLNPTGDIVIANNTLPEGVNVWTFWDNNWTQNEEGVFIPEGTLEPTYFEIYQITDNIIRGAIKISSNGTGIKKATISYSLGGQPVNVTADDDGIFVIEGDINGGAVLYYGGEAKKYQNATTMFMVPAKTVMTASDLSIKALDNGNFKITLKSSSNATLGSGNVVNVLINGKSYTGTTDDSGVATIKVNFNTAGTYYAYATFEGNEYYKQATANAKITVSKKATSLTAPTKIFKVKATKKVTVTLKSGSTALKGKKVSITVNGKTYTGTTNAKGQATVTVKITKAGTYKYTAKFAGDGAYNAKSAKGTIKVKK